MSKPVPNDKEGLLMESPRLDGRVDGVKPEVSGGNVVT